MDDGAWQRWVWVAGPHAYLDEDGGEHRELIPGTATFWTCDRDTRRGDLAVLYRSKAAKDIAYLLRATSEAYSLDGDSRADPEWEWGCDVEVLERFPNLVAIADLRADPVTAQWPALRASFVRGSAPVPDAVWGRLLEMAGSRWEALSEEQPDSRGVLRLLDLAIDREQPLVAAHVRRLRERHPEASPDDLCRLLERRYLAALTGSGAAAGAAAAAPGVGTAASIAMSAGETLASLQVTVLFVLSIAEVHGVQLADVERRRTLLLSLLVGDAGPAAVAKAAERVGKHWARLIVDAIPMQQILRINRVLGARFVTKYGTKQGILVLGRAVPFGLGVGLGAAGNAAVAWSVVRGVRRAFGPAALPTSV